MTRQELIATRDELLKRLSEIESKTVYNLVVNKEERAKLNDELDKIEISIDEMA